MHTQGAGGHSAPMLILHCSFGQLVNFFFFFAQLETKLVMFVASGSFLIWPPLSYSSCGNENGAGLVA